MEMCLPSLKSASMVQPLCWSLNQEFCIIFCGLFVCSVQGYLLLINSIFFHQPFRNFPVFCVIGEFRAFYYQYLDSRC